MTKKIILTLILAMVTIVLASSSTAINIENIDFNISSEFKPIDDAVGLQFQDENNNITLRILDDESRGDSISDMNQVLINIITLFTFIMKQQ